ncbi:MAG: EAL domain-containing protein [Legionellaceae bacterium]|nr:EAL domain-containing protein [Legionellaceae bacterium]
MDRIEMLHELGVSVSLDDFGTGYSSLSRLKNLKFDLIKIDKSFLQELETSIGARKTLEVFSHLGRIYQIPTLVEGIESKEELEEVCNIGFTYGQGFYFSKPLDVFSMTQLVKKFSDRNTP